MMFERFTVQARDVVRGAVAARERLGHRNVGTEHLLLALLDGEKSSVAGLLNQSGVDAAQVTEAIERKVGRGTEEFGDRDAEALRSIGIDLAAVRSKLEESFGEGALESPPARSRWGLFGGWDFGNRFSARAKKVLELALREAVQLRHREIGAEHILLGLLREGRGVAALVLTEAGMDLAELRRRTLDSLRKAA
ncbi:Clp protease N-terminal domain-containing protein [Plantactinospora sp. KLBMP9567]|uniref:Clp protease N-terminal domain-containing protein n=1 Tax=Plantactinospora sp. KLBMP9567 TaxID=3085900 RepID=UPI0029810796|nr:Clp protease N-terminal domain-containing protein [Plantactinospora sp. KLBMP9567]MDW5330071.1 Clp protease N-terminal domain-containing protein [Plantactinospora sp. KLBMP9567]